LSENGQSKLKLGGIGSECKPLPGALTLRARHRQLAAQAEVLLRGGHAVGGGGG